MSDAPTIALVPLVEADVLPAAPATGRYNRELLRTRFATCDLSLNAFAQEQEITYATASKFAEADDWVGARERYRRERAIEAQKAALQRSVEVETHLDGIAHKAAVKLTEVASNILESVVAVHEQAQANNGPGILSLHDAPRLKTLVETLEKAHRLARISARLPAEPVPTSLGMDPGRLDPEERENLQKYMRKMAVGGTS